MKFLSFTSRKTFITSFSKEQAIMVIQEMLSSKSKILFFTIRHYFGYVRGQEFTFSTYNGYQTRLLIPMVKGKVAQVDRTVVDLKFQVPIIPTCFLLVVPMMFLPSLFTMDEMTINGELREPTMIERIGFALFFISVPALLFYLNCLRPLQKLHLDLKNNLQLEEITQRV